MNCCAKSSIFQSPAPEIADFLTGVVDVVNQGFVVGLELLRILVLVLFNVGLDADHQVDLLVLS